MTKSLTKFFLFFIMFKAIETEAQLYQFSPSDVDVNANGIATKIPDAIPESQGKRLVYLRSKNEVLGTTSCANQITYTEKFNNVTPVSTLLPANADNHYFVLVDDITSLLYFSTTIYNLGRTTSGNRANFTIPNNSIGTISQLPQHYVYNIVSQCYLDYRNNIWWGVDPPKPISFVIKEKTKERGWATTSKVTEGDSIQFEITGPENFSKFNIEISYNGGVEWHPLFTNVSSNTKYKVNPYSDFLTYINLSDNPGAKSLKFRAKTYFNENSILGVSFGYVEQTLEVYPVPKFTIKTTPNYCSGDTGIREIVINVSEFIQKANSIHFTVKPKVGNPINWTKIIDNTGDYSITNEYSFLTTGEYEIIAEYYWRNSRNELFGSGDIIKPYNVTQRGSLENLLISGYEPTCYNSSYYSVNIKNNSATFSGISVLKDGNKINDLSKVNLSNNSNIFTLKYNDSLTCKTEHNIIVTPSIPNYSFTVLSSQNCYSDPISIYVDLSPSELDSLNPEFIINSPGFNWVDIKDTIYFPSSSLTTPTSYSVGVRFPDGKGGFQECKSRQTIEITPKEEISFSLSSQPVTVCDLNSNGKITVNNIRKAVAPINIQLKKDGIPIGSPYYLSSYSSLTSKEFSGLVHGEYTVSIIDKNGCEKINPVDVGQPDEFRIDKIILTDPLCKTPSNSGAIEVFTKGEKSSISIAKIVGYTSFSEKFNGSTGIKYNNYNPGFYTVRVQPSGYSVCYIDSQVELNDIAQLYDISLEITQPTCTENFGLIEFSGAVTYEWKYPHNTNWSSITGNYKDLPSGYYNFRGKNQNGCYSNVLNDSILNTPKISFEYDSVFQPKCFGDKGSIDFKIAGCTSDIYSIEYNGNNLCQTPVENNFYYTVDNNNIFSIHNITGSIYEHLSIKNGTYCYLSKSYDIPKPIPIEISVSKHDYKGYNIKCKGGTTELTVNVSGGTPKDYGYTLVNPFDTNTSDEFTFVFDPVNAGNYSFIAIDKNGCKDTTTVSVSEPNPITLQINDSTNPTCFNSEDGSVNVEIKGGIKPYFLTENVEYPNFDTETFKYESINEELVILNSKKQGKYFYSVTNEYECEFNPPTNTQPSVILDAPSQMSLSIENPVNPTCKERSDGKISVTVSNRSGEKKIFQIIGKTINFTSDSTIEDTYEFNNLKEDTFSITIYDKKNCSESIEVPLFAPDSLTYSLIPQNLTCKGDSSGEIKVNIEGGTKNYSVYLKRDNEDISFDSQISSSQKTFSNLNPGNYSIILSDANGCEVTPIGNDTVIISEPEEYLNIVLDSIPVRCYGESSGSITAIAQHGWGNYTFKLDTSDWSLVADTLTFTNQKIGDYIVFVKDSMGCTISDTITVTQPDTLYVEDIIIFPVSCFGGDNGAISILPIGGNGGYTFDFGEGFSENSDFTNLTAGNYYFTIEDSKECAFFGSIKVPQPEQFNLSKTPGNYNGYNIRCYGSIDSVSLQLTGGTVPYSYLLTDTLGTLYHSKSEFNNEEFVADNLPAGKYLLDFTDSNNCPFTESITLSQPEKLGFDTIFLIQPNCFGSPDGHIELTGMHGGASEFKFNLTTFTNQYDSTHTGNSTKFWNLASDTLFVSVLDDNSCSIDTSLLLNQPQPVSAKFNVNPVICKGDSNGSISVQLSGGTGSYEQTWYNSDSIQLSTSQFIDSKAAGTYLFRASDLNGCKAIDPVLHNDIFNIEIPEPENPLTIEVESITSTRCFGESNGEISLLSSGGWNNHVYAVDNGDIDFTENNIISNLKAGDYAIFLRDSAGCVVSTDVTVSQPDSLILSADLISDVTCFGENSGSVNLSATGGNYDYLFSVNSGESQESNTFQSLAAGFYNFSVTDKLGCENYLDIAIEQPEQINYSVSKMIQPICGGSQGELEILPLGGTLPTFVEWLSHQLPSEFNVTNLKSGNYTFKLTDSNGCSHSFTEVLNDIDGPTVEIIKVVNPTCSYRNDGSIEISVSGGTEPNTISWIGNNQNYGNEAILSDLLSGSYIANVTDLNGCFASVSANLSAPAKITYNSSVCPVNCFGTPTGSVSAQISGGTFPYSINWFNNDNQNIGNGVSAESLPAGEYYLSVKDLNGCGINSDSDTLSQNIVVNQPQDPLQALISQIIKPKCFGDSNAKVTLSGKGGWSSYKYSLDGNSFADLPVFSNLSAGNGQGFVKDKYGCIAEIEYEISQPNQLNHYVTNKSEVKCNGESNGWVSVETVGGTLPYSYSINSGESWTNQNSFFGLSKGNYTVLAKDINNCTSSISFDIEEPESLQVSMSNITSTYCGTANGQIVLSALGGTEPYTVYWSHLDKPWGLTVSELQKGYYTATILDANGCSESIDLEMPEIDGPKIDNFSIFSPLCNDSDDGQVNVDFTGISKPFRYFLNDTEVDSSLVNGLVKGDYTFKVTDKFGCTDEQLINLPAPEPIEIEFPSAINPVCFGYSNGSISSLVSGGTSPYNYNWSNSSENSNLNNIPAGNYSLTVTDFHNCTQSATVSLYDPEQMETDLPEKVNLCIDQSVTLNAENPGCLYWWTSTNSFESSDQEVTLTDDGWYYLQVTNSKGCFVTDTVHVKQHNYAVSATLLVPSTAKKNDTIVVVDISWPIPDSLYWGIPLDFTVLYDSPYEKHIKANQEGLYDIRLVTYVGECSAFNEKSIDIDKENSVELQKVEKTDIIKSVSLAPNPASFITRIGVNLSVETDITIEMYSGFGVKVLGKKLSGSDSYSLQIPLNGLSPGMYMVKVSALNSYKTVKLMVE